MNRKASSWLARTAVLGMVAAGCGFGGRTSEFEQVPDNSPSSNVDVLQQPDSLEDVISLKGDEHSFSIDASTENEVSQTSINFYSLQKPIGLLGNIVPITNTLEANCEANSDCPEGAACEGNLCVSYSSSAFSVDELKTDALCYSNKDCWNIFGSDNYFCKDYYCTILTSSSAGEGICGEFIDNVWNFEPGNDQWEYMGYMLPAAGMILPACEIYHYSCNTVSLSQEESISVLDYFCGSALDEIVSAVLVIAKKASPTGALIGFGCQAYNLFSEAEKEEKKKDIQKISQEFGEYVSFDESEILKCALTCNDCKDKYTNFCLTPEGEDWLEYKSSAYCTYPAKMVMKNYAPAITGNNVLNESATNAEYTADIYISVSDSNLDVYKSYPPEIFCEWKDKVTESGKTVIYELGTYNCDEKLTYLTTKNGFHQLAITPTDPGALVFTFFDMSEEEGIGVNEPDYHKTPSLKWDGSKKKNGSPGYVSLEAKLNFAPVCTNKCDLDTTTCFGAGYVVCMDTDGDGCLEWGSLQLCPPETSCKSKSGKCETNAPVCIDECFIPDKTQCSGNGWKKCGYYDNDPCLDWSTITSCKATETCSGGSCEIDTLECTCTEWQWAIEYGCGKNGCECDERYQTRECIPSGCEIESKCALKESCIPTCSPELKSVELYPIQDTWVTSKYNEEILLDKEDVGFNKTLWIGGRKFYSSDTQSCIARIYLQYDLSQIKNASEIQQALVDIVDDGYSIGPIDSCGWSSSSSEFAYEFIPVSSSWSEDTLTWDDQPDFSAPSLEQPIKLKSYNGFTGFTQKKADLTEMIKYWQTSENKGLVLKVKDEDVFSDSCQFAFEYVSKEAVANHSFKLTVYYFE